MMKERMLPRYGVDQTQRELLACRGSLRIEGNSVSADQRRKWSSDTDQTAGSGDFCCHWQFFHESLSLKAPFKSKDDLPFHDF